MIDLFRASTSFPSNTGYPVMVQGVTLVTAAEQLPEQQWMPQDTLTGCGGA